MVMLSVNFGILVGYILSSHLSYHVVPLLGVCLPVLYFLAALLLPESPSYLLKHSKQKEAEKSLRFYKNPRENDEEQSFKMDFEELRSNIAAQQALITERLGFRDLLTKPALKGFASAVVLVLGHQCSGIFSFVNYMSTVFEASGSVFDVNTCTIIIGVFQIIGVSTSTICVDIIGRRILMLISTFGIGLGCIIFGFFTYYAHQYDLSRWNWIPLVLMIILVYLANVGLNGLFFLVLVEIFPAKIRSLATSISLVFLSGVLFGTLKVFPLMLHYLGISVTMWFSACSGFITFLYFMFCLPETKGKSMVVD
ncbi:facilitated trehalose transporter Tret1-like [Drosophila tropicalis]|uniref:facilitated trehalose transporter Tret1-like n=1 Tax=Drosophila tropicalis TaxID=46794 RepID=UPI0035AB954F